MIHSYFLKYATILIRSIKTILNYIIYQIIPNNFYELYIYMFKHDKVYVYGISENL